eukprot:TRINITY_DN10515_c2_g1_i1.p1 TRINITY_DN10515_c2_g1~~TRINITY_DN10515_c2_g1_i1.p1  ORF type:complete len:979 (+),score=199.68 TRINITY_DN10515_c2_g1_i1:172-3108(+)
MQHTRMNTKGRHDSKNSTNSEGDPLLFEDEEKTSEMLKDLISAAGLKGAWHQMSQKMKSMNKAHEEIMNLASREALDRAYIQRPEYEKLVVKNHTEKLANHTERLVDVEKQAANAVILRKKLADETKQIADKHDARISALEPTMGETREWIDRIDKREAANDLALREELRRVEAESRQQMEKLRQEVQSVVAGFNVVTEQMKVTQHNVEELTKFIHGEAFLKHIRDTCKDALTKYVHKEEMMTEVQKAAAAAVDPVKADVKRRGQDLAVALHQHSQKDLKLERQLDESENRLKEINAQMAARCDNLQEKLSGLATETFVKTAAATIDVKLREVQDSSQELKKLTTHKVQEVVDRLCEFQPILEDHEHALQHQAEEILNRSTKYDVAQCREKLETCALKDKVEKDLKDLAHTVSWQGTKLETLQYSNNFGNNSGSVVGSQTGSLSQLRSKKSMLRKAGSRLGGSIAGSLSDVHKTRSGATSPGGSEAEGGGRLSPTFHRSRTLSLRGGSVDAPPRDGDQSPRTSQLAELVNASKSMPSQDQVSAKGVKSTNSEVPLVSSDIGAEQPSQESATILPHHSVSQHPRLLAEQGDEDDGDSDVGNAVLDAEALLELQMQQQESQFMAMMEQIEEQKNAAANESVVVLSQQLECLAQVVLALGRACLRPLPVVSRPHTVAEIVETGRDSTLQNAPKTDGLSGLSRNARWDHSSELLYHLSSISHWITNRQVPGDWDPTTLATLALHSLPHPGSAGGGAASLMASLSRPSTSPASPDAPKTERGSRRQRPKVPFMKVTVPEAVAYCSGRAFMSGGIGWQTKRIGKSPQLDGRSPRTSPVAPSAEAYGPQYGTGLKPLVLGLDAPATSKSHQDEKNFVVAEGTVLDLRDVLSRSLDSPKRPQKAGTASPRPAKAAATRSGDITKVLGGGQRDFWDSPSLSYQDSKHLETEDNVLLPTLVPPMVTVQGPTEKSKAGTDKKVPNSGSG